VIVLVIPAGVAKGPASLQILVNDRGGRHRSLTRTVRIASSS
jgi:hypothetical protein